MQTSVKEIIESIETIATVYFSDEIKYIGFNKYPKSEVEKDCIALVYYIDSYPTAVNTSKVAIRFEFLDLISTIDDRDERRKEVFSDTDGVATAFIQYLSNNNHYIDDNTTKEAIEPKTNDGIGGTSITAVFNYEKSCIVTGNGYDLKALTILKEIPSTANVEVAVADVALNGSGLDVYFKRAYSTDSDLNLTISEDKLTLTIQTDELTTRVSNIDFTISNGVVNTSAVIVANVDSSAPSGIQYKDVYYNGGVSFLTYDETWRLNNDKLNNPTIENPEIIQALDYSLGIDKLLYNNIYGNKERWTDLDGGQSFSNSFIDHLTGRAYYYSGFSNNDILQNHISTAFALTVEGHSEWYVPSFGEMVSLYNYTSENNWLSSLPWSSGFNPNNKGYYSSTFIASNTAIITLTNTKSFSTIPTSLSYECFYTKLINEL